MSREVDVDELPKRINEIIAAIQAGESITYLRNGKMIRTFDPIVSQRGVPFPFRDLVITPLKQPITIDVVDLIREDRDDEIRKHGF